MVANSESFDITNDSDLQSAVRTETGYDDGKLSSDNLTGVIESAKRVLALKADTTGFYDDRGMSVALLGITCAKAKGRTENQPVQVKNLGTDDVTFRTSDGGSLQVTQYEQMTQLGLSNADNTNAGTTSIRFTNNFMAGDLDDGRR